MEEAIPGRMTNPKEILAFIHAGRARITLVSEKTGVRFTYRISAKKDKPAFVALLSGPENESNYTYIGFISNERYIWGKKSRVKAQSPSNMAFAYVYRHLMTGVMPPSVEIWHEGRCGRCAKVLTVPESIKRGFGAKCLGKVFG